MAASNLALATNTAPRSAASVLSGGISRHAFTPPPKTPVAVPAPTRQPPTETQLLALQAFAIETNSIALLRTTYIALGRDSRYAFEPVTERERRIALQSCADQIEMLAAMGTVIS